MMLPKSFPFFVRIQATKLHLWGRGGMQSRYWQFRCAKTGELGCINPPSVNEVWSMAQQLETQN